jgi:hypothetical protein
VGFYLAWCERLPRERHINIAQLLFAKHGTLRPLLGNPAKAAAALTPRCASAVIREVDAAQLPPSTARRARKKKRRAENAPLCPFRNLYIGDLRLALQHQQTCCSEARSQKRQ